MNCGEARLHIGADPGAASAALDEHLRACAGCRKFRVEMVALEGNIRRALEVPLDRARAAAPAGAPAPGAQRHPRTRRWALAASLLVTVTAGGLFWGLRPADALAAEVVEHVALEPDSWSSATRVDLPALEAVLAPAGVRIEAAPGDVVYARRCRFRGHDVPHLVVSTDDGPVTVLVLAAVTVESRREFSEEGYAGVLVPAARGSVALLARADARMDDAVRSVLRALHWDGAAPGA
jgi:hypothetical protein